MEGLSQLSCLRTYSYVYAAELRVWRTSGLLCYYSVKDQHLCCSTQTGSMLTTATSTRRWSGMSWATTSSSAPPTTSHRPSPTMASRSTTTSSLRCDLDTLRRVAYFSILQLTLYNKGDHRQVRNWTLNKCQTLGFLSFRRFVWIVFLTQLFGIVCVHFALTHRNVKALLRL